MTEDDFINEICNIAAKHGHKLEASRNGRQINFGKKKLHEGHLKRIFPFILRDDSHIPTLINEVAPGRPCSHKPMRLIIEEIKNT